jgi:hypothetical protein
MGIHSDWYWLFHDYWWLLFPAGWALGQMLKNILRHSRASEALAVLKTYADQGKEPPPELVAVLRQPEKAEERRAVQGGYWQYGWIPVFLFGAMTVGFLMFAIWPPGKDIPKPALIFAALIMAGLCIGNLAVMLARRNQAQRDRIPLP